MSATDERVSTPGVALLARESARRSATWPRAFATSGASTVVASRPAKNTVPDSSPTAVSETEKSPASTDVTGPMLPPFHAVPAANSAVASVTRAAGESTGFRFGASGRYQTLRPH
jgi:hypothetical protein